MNKLIRVNKQLDKLELVMEQHQQVQTQLELIKKERMSILQDVFKECPDSIAQVDQDACFDYFSEHLSVDDPDAPARTRQLHNRLAHAIKRCADASVHVIDSEAEVVRWMLERDGHLVLHAAKAYTASEEMEHLVKAFGSLDVIKRDRVSYSHVSHVLFV